MSTLDQLSTHIENHNVAGIQNSLENGIGPNDSHHGMALIHLLISMYNRSSRFNECVQVFVDSGLEFENKTLLAVLLNDEVELRKLLSEKPELVHKSISLDCCYTSLNKVSLLHVCAEYNHVNCAKVLVEFGAEINAQAGLDENGLGGQTPIFHTVNQNKNNSSEMLDFLLEQNADLSHQIKGLIWGQGYPWETMIPSVNPISYAKFGLLPQMHRDERVIDKIIRKLMKHEFQLDYVSQNVPNAYLKND